MEDFSQELAQRFSAALSDVSKKHPEICNGREEVAATGSIYHATGWNFFSTKKTFPKGFHLADTIVHCNTSQAIMICKFLCHMSIFDL